MAYVLVWQEKGVGDKQFEVFTERKAAERAAVERRQAGADAYVVAGDAPPADVPGATGPGRLPGAFRA